QTAPAGHATMIGNRGWWPRGGSPARFDQQPIEAYSMVAAAGRASEVTGEPRWGEGATRFYRWFLRDHDLGVRAPRPEGGACHDGRGPDGVNGNQGAESTIAWLLSVEIMRRLLPDATTPSPETALD